jgi:Cyclic nucleotide-binding domain
MGRHERCWRTALPAGGSRSRDELSDEAAANRACPPVDNAISVRTGLHAAELDRNQHGPRRERDVKRLAVLAVMPRSEASVETSEKPSRVPSSSQRVPRTLPASWLQDRRARWSALSPGDRCLGILRGLGVVILSGLPLFLFLNPRTGIDVAWPGARLVWTVVIALLPLAIVAMGFYTWRQICPLAFWARMSEWIGWPDKPGAKESERRRGRVPAWLARSYPYVTWGFLAVLLALRILLINSHAASLAWTFVGLMALAALVGFRYTGKTWCNFFCPVFIVELLYTDGDKPQYRDNSICPTCTGCKTRLTEGLCPDINQENNYWKELKLPARAFAYYAFPGLVLGFYAWYFLHRPYYWHDLYRRGLLAVGGRPIDVPPPGTTYDWGYYLSGDWTREPQPWTHWLEPGFGFEGLPVNLPVILAVPLTLMGFSILSYVIFKALESLWLKVKLRRGLAGDDALEAVRHLLFAWAGFAAFTIFYAFAGAPTLRQMPGGLYGLFQFVAVVLATWVLSTRLRRTRAKQLQFDQARRWVEKWPFPGETPPADLEQAYATFTLRTQLSADRRRVFKEVVHNSLSDNLITIDELDLLDALAKDLGVDESDQRKVIREIGQEAPEYFDPRYQGRLSDQLRLIGYRGELERALSENRGILPDAPVLQQIQARYRVQPPEHDEVIKDLRDPRGARTQHLRREIEELRRRRRDVVVLAAHPSPAVDFLLGELEQHVHDDCDHLLRMANLYGPAGDLDPWRLALRRDDAAACEPIADWARQHLPEELAVELVAAVCARDTFPDLDTSPRELIQVLLRLSQEGDLDVRAATLHALGPVWGWETAGPIPCPPEDLEAARAFAERSLRDPDPRLREAAVAVLAPVLSSEQWSTVLHDDSVAVRRAAINRVSCPVPTGIRNLVSQARNDPDERVALAAAAVCDNAEPRLPGGQPLPRLTTLERMFLLRSASLLAHLPSDSLHSLAEGAEEAHFERGAVLCREGEISDLVYLLIEGQAEAVQTRQGREVRLGVAREGECVGEMAVLDPGPRIATVRALDVGVHALTVHGADFRRVLSQDPATSLTVMRLMIQRQRHSWPPTDAGG